MANMGVQLEPISQSLEPYGPWHFGDVRFQQDRRAELEAALRQTAAIPGLSDRLLELSKVNRADCHSPARPEVTLSVSKVSRSTTSQGSAGQAPGVSCLPTTIKTCRSIFPKTLHPSLSFTQLIPSGETVVTFPLWATSSPPARPCLKRRRPDTDVDGPNTAALSCKKRRLLWHLITSRLSQPYSLPATHILNRESVTTGDKRFLKLAAIMSARRLNSAVTAHSQPAQQPPKQPNPSTWLRRAAMLNSLRSRVCAAAAAAAATATAPGKGSTIPGVSDFAAKAAVFQQHGHGSSGSVGGWYLVDASSIPRRGTPVPAGSRAPTQTPSSFPSHPHPPPPPGFRSSTTGGSSIHMLAPPSSHASGTCTTTTHLRIPSPTLRPLRSPELRVTRPLVPVLEEDVEELLDHRTHVHDDDEDDDDSMAFPTSELESRYEDDPEEDEGGGGVYADFSVIFGGGEGGIEEDEEGVGDGLDHYEDYMDDLDGIPWGARC